MATHQSAILIISAAARLRHSLQAVVASLPAVSAVYTAANSPDAIQQCTTTTVDLVLLDSDLPRATQRVLLRYLRQAPQLRPIILFGGVARSCREALGNAIVAWLPSGFSTEQLLRSIQQAQQLLAAPADAARLPLTSVTYNGSPTEPSLLAAKEVHMEESNSRVLVTALRDFFMARNGAELQAAYLALTQAAAYQAPRVFNWNDLEFAFNRLFVGPKALFAPPYASIYLDPDPRLMGRTTLQMRDFYRLLTLSLPVRQELPEDHLGVELDAYRQLQIAAAKVNSPELTLLLGYLRQHLHQWIPAFVARVHCAAETPLAILFVVDQLSRWLEGEEATNLIRPLIPNVSMIGAIL